MVIIGKNLFSATETIESFFVVLNPKVAYAHVNVG